MSTGDSTVKMALDRGPAGDLWRHTLARIPTLFGRLLYLTSLRNPHNGQYEHAGMAQMLGPEQAAETLRHSHSQVFQEWLCLSLERQKTDLEEYLSGLPGNPATVLATWLRVAPYRNLVPPSAQDVENRLYITDMETILELLKGEYGAASQDPES